MLARQAPYYLSPSTSPSPTLFRSQLLIHQPQFIQELPKSLLLSLSSYPEPLS
jgi:hypothetical protein